MNSTDEQTLLSKVDELEKEIRWLKRRQSKDREKEPRYSPGEAVLKFGVRPQRPRRIWGDSMEESFSPNFCFGRNAIGNQAATIAQVEHLLGRPVHGPWI
jgi:hypothetical protein